MVEVRAMRPSDVEAAYEVVSFAFAEERSGVLNRSPEEVAARLERYRHFLRHDPEGAFVATEGGRVVGVAVALLREDLWVLSLFAVERGYRGSGVGGALMRRALAYGEGWVSGMIASSTHPAAMRSYALAGFSLHPTLVARGEVAPEKVPAGLEVRDGGEGVESDLDLAVEVDRRPRGASHGPDLEQMLGRGHLLVSEGAAGRGYAVVHEGSPRLIGATDAGTASRLLWACLADSPGKEMEVAWITAAQDWAVRVALAAGLRLEPAGPICVKGDPGSLYPYLPSGPYL